MILTNQLGGNGAALLDSSYRRHAAFCWAFFCRRGRRDLFLGGSFPFFMDFAGGLASTSDASPLKPGAADSFLSAIILSFAKRANLHSTVPRCRTRRERAHCRGA